MLKAKMVLLGFQIQPHAAWSRRPCRRGKAGLWTRRAKRPLRSRSCVVRLWAKAGSAHDWLQCPPLDGWQSEGSEVHCCLWTGFQGLKGRVWRGRLRSVAASGGPSLHILRAGRAARWQPQERKQGAHCDANTDQGMGGWWFRLLLW